MKLISICCCIAHFQKKKIPLALFVFVKMCVYNWKSTFLWVRILSILNVNSMILFSKINNDGYILYGPHQQSCLRSPIWTENVLKWAATWQNQQSECVPSEDSFQPGHPPSLIRVFAVRLKKPCVLSYPLSTQRRLWSDWADAQADLSLRWAHTHFVGFVMSWLK